VLCKLDLEKKAYTHVNWTHVNWDFLLYMLRKSRLWGGGDGVLYISW
jgi:hypothetical protein